MEVRAIAKNVKATPKKARIPAKVVKGMNAEYALSVLKYTNKAAARDVYKVIESALANARHNLGVTTENLIVANIFVTEGRKLRRFRAGSRGNAKPFVRRYSNIEVILADLNSHLESKAKKVKESVKSSKVEKPVVEKKVVAKKSTAKKVTKKSESK